MWWPLRREPKPTIEEIIAREPMPPCGAPRTHYEWEMFDGMPCPLCTRKEQDDARAEKQDILAEKIAEAVVRILNGKQPPQG